MLRKLPGWLSTLVLLLHLPAPTWARDLTFEDRVRAEEALARVRYARQAGAHLPFEVAVPREALEARVRETLAYSEALARVWHTPLTGDTLRRELDRQERDSLDPEVLEALSAALDHDPALLRECLARPLLAEGLIRGFYAFDGRLHASARQQIELVRQGLLQGRRNLRRLRVMRSESTVSRTSLREVLPPIGVPSRVEERPEAFAVRVLVATTRDTATFATYAIPKRPFEDWWSSVGSAYEASAEQVSVIEEPSTPSSERMEAAVACERWIRGFQPVGEAGNRAVWTGEAMIVQAAGTFSRYDPATDTWAAIAVPDPVPEGEMVWTGREVLVIQAGSGDRSASYLPGQDRWKPIRSAGKPAFSSKLTVVWTGKEALAWGSEGIGARYSPSSDRWSPLSTSSGPAPLRDHVAVWTGSRMLVWGSLAARPFDVYEPAGYAYDPQRNAWAALPGSGQPEGRIDARAVWTGREMIVFGGRRFDREPFPEVGTGGRFDPTTSRWRPIASGPGAVYQSMVWSGNEMIVFGGEFDTGVAGDTVHVAARYDPSRDRWTAITRVGSPGERGRHAAVWTGSRMLVWGGEYVEDGFVFGPMHNGGRYDPRSDTWTSLGSRFAPTPRWDHTAVWIGSEMLVWGGCGQEGCDPVGGRFEPGTASWRPLPRNGAPSGRAGHTAVWDGQSWIVWGGRNGNLLLGDGARFDPHRNRWTPLSSDGAPTARERHVAVWSGHEMLIWGNGSYPPDSQDGAAYDPAANRWRPISSQGQPEAVGYPAVWTGTEMLVWVDGFSPAPGAAYDPARDTWRPMAGGGPGADEGSATPMTGGKVLYWSGSPGSFAGGIYDSTQDAWLPVGLSGSPDFRQLDHTAVWDARGVLIWGGRNDFESTDRGAGYDPAKDAWAEITRENAPRARNGHTAVWTGRAMLIWGGTWFDEFDSWTPYADLSAYVPGAVCARDQ